jgi:hypothetical protein
LQRNLENNVLIHPNVVDMVMRTVARVTELGCRRTKSGFNQTKKILKLPKYYQKIMYNNLGLNLLTSFESYTY